MRRCAPCRARPRPRSVPPATRPPIPCASAFSTRGCRRKSGTERVVDVHRNVDGDRQSIPEPHACDVQIGGGVPEFLAERHQHRVAMPEEIPQELAQLGEHLVRRLRIAMDQGGDVLQRVEQEVGMELSGQRDQSLLGDLRPEALALEGALAGPPSPLDEGHEADDCDPGQDVTPEREREVVPERRPQRQTAVIEEVLDGTRGHDECDERCRADGDRVSDAVAVRIEATGAPDHERERDGDAVPGHRPHAKEVQERGEVRRSHRDARHHPRAGRRARRSGARANTPRAMAAAATADQASAGDRQRRFANRGRDSIGVTWWPCRGQACNRRPVAGPRFPRVRPGRRLATPGCEGLLSPGGRLATS